MQHTTCTEDRIHHALERCLHGLGRDAVASRWAAGLCLNCWSLQELVSRDAGNYLILVEKILGKTKEVQDRCDYDLVTPLALLFYSAVLYAPHLPPGSELLLKAASVYHGFLTWPVPYCDTSRELLTFISNELKAPGITFQRLVRTEQGLPVKNYQSSTVTVLLLNHSEVQSEFVSIARRLSSSEPAQHSTLLLLLQHLYQATFGTRCDLDGLASLTLPLLPGAFCRTAACPGLPKAHGGGWVAPPKPGELAGWPWGPCQPAAVPPLSAGEAQPRKLQPFPIPPARCYTYSWDQDNFDILNDVLSKECSVAEPLASENEEEDEDEEEEEDVETDGGSPGQDSLLAPLCALPGDSVYSVLAEEGSRPPRVSLFASPKESISELTVVSRKSLKSFAEPQEDAQEQLPILADMILYYCRFASRPVLLQLYQTELTFIGGEKRTEVFIHSLELGHSAATRAIKASGPGSKRLGIDGDREAIPLTLQIAYSKTAASGRSHWNDVEKVCTSVNLSKACRRHEELASKTECLNLTVTEVVKRQNSKSKKSFNQISVSQIKVDKVQIIGVQSSFAVCLDQDEQKILQSVTRCEISVCYKPRDCDPLTLRGSPVAPQDPSEFQSLLCLPIATFSGALP
uniref:Phosphoinositide 3-kinase regulatory subunit 5 n=1 Tax=Zonotrichia albicollis TaxID=44394 RepID=A0A8D2MMG7_ZONAL